MDTEFFGDFADAGMAGSGQNVQHLEGAVHGLDTSALPFGVSF